jgi:hypothetical protein
MESILELQAQLAEIYASNKQTVTEIEELKFYDYDEKFRPFICGLHFCIVG